MTDEGMRGPGLPGNKGRLVLLLPASSLGRVVHRAPPPGLEGDEEDACDELYYFDSEARELKLFRDDIPRGILPAHADDSSTEVWCSLQPVMQKHQQALSTAESAIYALWQQKPHARYARLVYDGYYPAHFGTWMPTKERFSVADGNWVSTANLPSVLVFRGEKVPRSAKMVGGRGYFYCDAHTGTLLGYALTK